MKNVFSINDSKEIIERIETLEADTKALWGTMDVAQMMAHCNVTYEMAYEDKHVKAKGLKKFFLKMLIKNIVVGEKPYSKNGRTAPEFLITDERKFKLERKRLVEHIRKTQELGAMHFEGKESNSFGALTSSEWNNMFYKHLNHHLGQFGV